MAESLGMKLGKCARRLHSVMDNSTGGEVSAQQLRILGYLTHKGGCAVQKDIEQSFRLSRPAVSQILDHMVENGLVTREISKGDRRSRLVTLTDEGKHLSKSTYEKICNLEKKFFSVLSEEEKKVLVNSLDKIYKALEEYSDKTSC